MSQLSDDVVVFNALAGTPGSRPALRDSAGVVLYLDDYAGVKPDSTVAGAYGKSVYLASTEGGMHEPTYTLQRFDLDTVSPTTVAGPGSALGGLVTSAKTVDGT